MRTSSILAVSAIFVAVLAVVFYFFAPNRRPSEPEIAAPSPITAPTPTTPAKAETVVKPSFDVVRISREGTGVIAGRAAPNARVSIRADKAEIGAVVANMNGEWVLIFDTPLAPGDHELTIVATRSGAAPVESDAVVIVSLPKRQPETFAEDTPEGVVAVLTPRRGGVSRVLQKPGMVLERGLSRQLRVETIDYDQEGRAAIAGKGPAGAEIRIYIDNSYQGTATGDETGRWVFEPATAISPGAHVLRLDQIFKGDDVQIRIEQPFDRDQALDASLATGHVVVKPGNSLWKIARRLYGSGIRYTLIFRANENQIRDPDLIYPGQLFLLPKSQSEAANAPGP